MPGSMMDPEDARIRKAVSDPRKSLTEAGD